jgi:hypothetical protein
MGSPVDAGNAAFPTVRIAEVKPFDPAAECWLVEGIWGWRAVGVLGGPPKSTKTWTAVDLALSVATGTKVFEMYRVPKPGPVVFFAAEDAQARIRERFAAIAARRSLALKSLDVHLLDVPALRLDDAEDQARLRGTLRRLAPRLLVLDPLVRLHRADENSSGEISALLSFLRSIERELETAIVLVHHTRKDAGSAAQPGLGLRGSSDLWAWGDSNLYLRRTGRDRSQLTIEHRSAPAPSPVTLVLVPDPQPHLEVLADTAAGNPDTEHTQDDIQKSVLEELRNSPTPLRLDELRARLRVRKQRVVEALRELSESHAVERRGDGFVQKQLHLE